MADPLGVSGIAIGVAALFTTCLQVWDFVDAGKAHARTFGLLRTKLENQRLLFVIWGRKIGFGGDAAEGRSYDERLDDPFIAPTVIMNLGHIQQIFSDTQGMIDRYGIRVFDRKSKGKDRKRMKSRRPRVVQPQTLPPYFQSQYKRFLGQIKQKTRST